MLAPLLAALALLALLGFSSPSALAAEACPNAALRTGFSADLPECRAYELVSTAFTNNEDVLGGLQTTDGRHVFWGTVNTEGGAFAAEGASWVAGRAASGWVSRNVIIPGVEVEGAGGIINGGGPRPVALSEDGSSGVYITAHALVPADTNEALDVYAGSLQSGFTWLTESALRGPLYGSETYMEPEGATADLSTVVFQAHEQLTTNAPTHLAGAEIGREIYEWHEGRFELVSVLPGETTGAPGGAAVGYSGFLSNSGSLNAVSANGSLVFFESPDPGYNPPTPPQLYARINGERSVEVSAPAAGVNDPHGEQTATYRAATPDGSRVFFTSPGRLTTNANTHEDKTEDLYMYQLGSAEPLTDISSAGLIDPEGSQVQGVVGVSENGAMVYFVAKGVLSGANGEGKQPTEGAENLYLWHAGTLTFVASLNEQDGSHQQGVWGLTDDTRPADVTPDGEHLAVMSRAMLTKYNNAGQVEMYEYDAEREAIVCVSCNLTGAPPTAGGVLESSRGVTWSNGRPRFMTDNGATVIFDSAEQLVPGAADGQANVYEYRAGHQYLLSTGMSPTPSNFATMSAEGQNIYFSTRQPLVPSASGENYQLYDARVDGGFPETAVASTRCNSVECQPSAIPPPALAAPTSALVAAEGDIAHAAPGKRHAGPRESTKKLHRALKRCRRIHRHKRHKLRACMRRVRERYSFRVLRRHIHDAKATIVVHVPSAGKLIASGKGIHRVAKRIKKKGGRAAVTVRLKRRLRRKLRHHGHRHHVKVKVHLKLKPKRGKALKAHTKVRFS